MSGVNPLAKHFRQPAIYLALPSKGQYWPEGSIDLPLTGQIPVYPMTTRDEIVLRTPDALLNGEGVVSTIQSCCPSIKNAWFMPNNDSDAILIAIRIASYGPDMDVDSKCPNCNSDNQHTIDLNYTIDRVNFPNFDNIIKCNNLKIKLKPQTYEVANKANLAAFEEQKMLINLITESSNDESKVLEFNKRLASLNELNIDLLTGTTDYIETNDGTRVTDPNFIAEFYENADSKIIRSIKKAVETIKAESNLPKIGVTCSACENAYEVGIEFDYARFFDQDS